MRRVPVWTFALLCAPLVARAQARAGGEFRVNTTTTGTQAYSSVGGDLRGNFVVVWGGFGRGDILGQRYDRTGQRVGGELVVSPSTPSGDFPSVAMNARGEFLVAWVRDGSLPGVGDVFGQLFDAAAVPVGGQLRLNDFTTGAQRPPTVAADGRGDFVVAWWSSYQDGDRYAMAGRRVSRQGTLLGGEFVANTYTTGNQYRGDVAAGPDGGFVVAWTSSPSPSGDELSVNAQRFDATGARLGDNFQVNTYTTGGPFAPAAAVAPDGSFVIAFLRENPDCCDIHAQRYTAAGDRIGGEFQVNSSVGGLKTRQHVSMDSAGNFVVAWTDYAADGSGPGVRARRFRADGTPRGEDFTVNTYTTGAQRLHAFAGSVASDAVGNFVVTWAGDQGDGVDLDVFAQRYGGLHPLPLQLEDGGNGVWEPGETAGLAPVWLNVNGAPLRPGGVLSNLTGPAGATYTITDGSATYPPLPDGTSARCDDCYAVNVSVPATRPATHWDAAATETLTPDTLGHVKRWTLHVGGSFTDVAAANPFYRFIEILLHEGVTTGCGGAAYCPAVSTPREQMAAFVLLAREGAAFAPPACTTPLFDDVPAGSPFCPFVEELARRGVVSGCGGRNFCPSAAVTREQMPVFVLRTLDPALNPPACGTPVFADVPASSPFCRWIEELVRRHVVAGCGGGNYCPTDPVTREQMAVFIAVTFGLTLYGP